MSRNNDVFKVMFLPEAAGQEDGILVSALTSGNWGIIDYETGLTIDASAATDTGPVNIVLPKSWFFVYIGNGTIGELNEVYTSSGTHIRTGLIHYLTINNDIAPVAQRIAIQTFTGVQSGADATNYDYGVKLDFRGNSEVYQRYGANQASKVFMGSTKCVGNAGAAEDAGAELCAQWAEACALDTDQFIGFIVDGTGIGAAAGVTYTPTGVPGSTGVWAIDGGATTEALALAEIRDYTTGSGNLIMTFIIGAGTYNAFSSMYSFCNVNAKYFKMRQIKAIHSLLGSDCAWATMAETVTMVYGEGYGYDVNEIEYLAGGFTGKPGPYRQSRLNGLPYMNVEFIATKTTRYTICVLAYDQYSVAGWLEHFNNESTYFILAAAASSTDAGYPLAVLKSIARVAGAPVTTT